MIKRKKNILAYVALTALTVGMLSNAKPMIVSACKDGEITKIQILGTTDVEGRFMNFDYSTISESVGGYNQISKVVKEKRAENPNTLVLDNGDCFGGYYNDLFTNDAFLSIEINPIAFSLGFIGYDCMVLGNNEFSFGFDTLDSVVGQVESGNTSVLCANVYRGNDRVYKPYTIKEVDGVRVAIIGVTTNSIVDCNGYGSEGYKFTRPDEEVRKVIDELTEENAADLFVVSANVGSESGYIEGDSCKDIANLCPEISVILAGGAYAGIEKETINGVLITGPKCNGAGLADIDLEIKKTSEGIEVVNKDATLINFNKDSAVDLELNKELEKYYDIAYEDASLKIGKLEGNNLCIKNEVYGIPESFVSPQGVTDLINSVQLYNCQKQLESMNINLKKAHIVSACSMSSLDANLMVGDITNAGLANIYKSDDKLCTVKITGKQLKKYLEWSAQFYNTFNKGDLTISFNKDFSFLEYDMFAGISYDINIAKESGDRIENLCFADGKKVKNKDVVYLAVNDYRYFSQLAGFFDKDEQELICESTDNEICDIRDMISDYIINVKGGCIDWEVEDNWKLTGFTYDEKLRDKIIQLINAGILEIDIKGDLVIESITYDDVIAQLKDLGAEDAIKQLEKIKNGDYSSIDTEIKVPVKNESASNNKNDSTNSNESENKTESTNKNQSSNKNESEEKNDLSSNTETTDKNESESKVDSEDKSTSDNVDSSSDTSVSDKEVTVDKNNSTGTSTKTGDSAKFILYGLAAVLSGVGVIFALKKKKDKEESSK